MVLTQSDRQIRLETPLGKDALLAGRASIVEELGRCFELDIFAMSEKSDLDADQILGEEISLECLLGEDRGSRFFHGHVTEFAQTGYSDGLHQYQIQVRPWLWFLGRTSDCRAFQSKTVPAIVEEVFREYHFTDYELRLNRSYEPWDYCVQYRETDLNFVSRLLEQEGIYYSFVHEKDKHKLVLSDDVGSHKATENYEELPFFPPDEYGAERERDHVSDWRYSKTVHPGAYALSDFDFENPQKDLVAKAVKSRPHAKSSYEMFDFPGEYSPLERKVGEGVAKTRLEELQAQHYVCRGEGSAIGLATGSLFKLTDHPRDDQNGEYLITSTRITVSSNVYSTDGGGTSESHVSFDCIESDTPYRPVRTTPKPLVTGTQSALVVGKSGEEIWTDKYGRVKVQFHWDRYGERDEKSSCWVRVAQVWAGKKWGAIYVPRIGEEVLVSFFEGDPDRPVITGRVYNGDSMPPYGLPANATQTGIKSRSSKGGGDADFNEIRFEDKKGSEEVYIHAQKDLMAVVENDESIHIMHDDSVKIDNDLTSEIGHDETRKIAHDRKTNVEGNEILEVGVDHTEKTGKNYELTAGDQITLKTGAAKIVMKKNGDIEISGKNISIKGTAKVDVKASSKATMKAPQIEVSGTQVTVKGTKTAVEGTMLDLKGSAIASLKGGLTKIG